MGMVISLAVAFVLTPWLARLWLRPHAPGTHGGMATRVSSRWFDASFAPSWTCANGQRNRRRLWAGIGGADSALHGLPACNAVVLKMLPFDNKSEFQVVVDMPAGTPLERTAATSRD